MPPKCLCKAISLPRDRLPAWRRFVLNALYLISLTLEIRGYRVADMPADRIAAFPCEFLERVVLVVVKVKIERVLAHLLLHRLKATTATGNISQGIGVGIIITVTARITSDHLRDSPAPSREDSIFFRIDIC